MIMETYAGIQVDAGKDLEEACIAAIQHSEDTATMGRYGVSSVMVGGRFTPIKSLPDFEGVMMGGRQFIFDAKVCGKASFPIDDKVMARQVPHMLRRARYGAISFLLVHFNPRELSRKTVPSLTVAVAVHPELQLWRDVDGGFVKSISRDHCLDYGVTLDWDKPGRAKRQLPKLCDAIVELEKLFF